MHKRDYFIKALKAEAYRHKSWVLRAFSITRPSAVYRPEDDFQLQLRQTDDGRYYFYQGVEDAMVYLEGLTPGQPPFSFREQIQVGRGDIENLDKNITTTYGNLLVNQMLLVYPFGNKIGYMEGEISIPRIEKIIEARIQDDPAKGALEAADAIYVSEYKKYNEAALALAGFSQLCVPSASPRTMTTDPRVLTRRAELLEENKDRLHDPVVQAMIDKELIALDKAWIKGDVSEGYFIKEKSFNIVRKKLFLLQGAEQGFDVAGDVIPTSLNEGTDLKYLPAMGNALREGSYNRGALTAQGGEATKFNHRMFQNTTVSEPDCGTPFGLSTRIPSDEASDYISSSVILKSGEVVELTANNIHQYVDKPIMLRSPGYCRTKGANFCAVCMGKKIATTPRAVSTYSADIGSTFMNVSLKSMHGKALTIVDYDLETSLR